MIKKSVHEDGLNILNVYAPNKRTSKYLKQNAGRQILGFQYFFSIIDRKKNQEGHRYFIIVPTKLTYFIHI
jgi:hypothetical protein